MSGLDGHLEPQSKASDIQGSIHTENPELLKLLQDVAPGGQDNKRPSPRKVLEDAERKETNTYVLDLHKKRSDTEHSKNIKNLINNQKKVVKKSEHLKNIFISDSGDAKGNTPDREQEEKYCLTDDVSDVKDIDHVNTADSFTGENIGIADEDSKGDIDSSDKESHQKKVRPSAETSGTRNLARKKNVIVEDPTLLSDIAESDCETVVSVSSELARIRSPSRSSLNADFDDCSVPSSPIHIFPSEGDKDTRNNSSESNPDRARSSASVSGRESIACVSNRRRAGATPYHSNQRHHSRTPSADFQKDAQDNSDCSNTPEVITPVASPAQPLLNINLLNYEPQGNSTHRSTSGSTTIPEKSLVSTTKHKTDELAHSSQQSVRSDITASTSLVTTVPISQVTSSRDQALRSDKLHPAYSELSPRLSPRSSQSEAINSRIQKLTKGTSLSDDTLTPRANIPYLSQRLKSQGGTGKRSISVSIVQDSLESQALDIENDSLEITQADNKKGDSNNYNQQEVKKQNNQDIESSLKESLAEYRTESKLDNNTWVPAKQTDNRIKKNNIVAIDSERRPTSNVDLQKKTQFLDDGLHKQTTNHGIQYAPSASKQEQEFAAPLTNSQPTEQEESEHREFVLRTHPGQQAAARNYPAEGSSKHLHHTANSTQTAGSGRSSNWTIPSVKKVYIESPVFSKEEEEVYRFVSSRLEDSKEEVMDTYRELDMTALDSQEKYVARHDGQKRVRYMDVDERYEDTDDQELSAEVSGQFPLAKAHAHNLGQLRQTAQRQQNTDFGEEYADKENQFGRYEMNPRNRNHQNQAYSHHPASLQDQNQTGIVGQGTLSHGSSNPQNQIFSNHQDFLANSNQRRNLNQLQHFANNSQVGYNQLQGLGNNLQTQPNEHPGLLNQQGHITQHGIFANRQVLNQQAFGDSRFQHPQILQRHPPNKIPQQPPNQDHNHQNNQEQPQENNTQPVRGLSLPTGPTYDPVDEEDLKRETNYQQGLRLRIEDRNRRTHQTTIPELPVSADRFQHDYDPQDYVQDSLDDEPYDEMAQSFSGGFVNDSLNMYTYQQPQQQQQYPQQTTNPFRNPPPPLPQNFASISVSNSNFPEYRSSRLDNVNFDSEDYTDHVGIRQQRVNPQIRPRFYNPEFDQQHGFLNNAESFDDEPSSDRHVDNTAYDVRQRYEDRDNEGVERQMEAVQPKPPKYDYVTHNKDDLGKPAPKSYIKILETTREEKERLHEVFIQPKRKPKGGVAKKQGQDKGLQREPVISREPENVEYMTAAEQVWAQRSATLAKKVDAGGNRGRRKGPGGLQKFNSDSSLSQTSIPHRRQSFQTTPQQELQQQQRLQQRQQLQQQQQLQLQQQLPHRTQQQKPPPPETRAFMTEMPTPLSGTSGHSQPMHAHNATQQHQTEITVQPITQHLLTQDGQRISVDVNLKLISPPSYGEGPQPYQYQQQPQQYPPPQHPQPQYYGGHGRKYPAAVSNYDDSGGEAVRNGIPALEYPLQEFYDSDSNDYRHGSPRERYSADEALRRLSESRTDLNPYGKIPPIGRSQGGDHPSSAPAPDQAGSYMEVYMKQKVKDNDRPWYKVYGLKDYRRMQKEVRLGALGPDLDSDAVKERREKMTRQQDYAKTVMEKNRSELAHKKPPAFPRPKEDNDIISRRKLAMEYAKSVPKPIVRVQPNEFNNYDLASEKSPIAKHHRSDTPAGGQNHTSPRQPVKKSKEMDILDLEKLRQRYEEDKMNEAIIRRNTHSFNREYY